MRLVAAVVLLALLGTPCAAQERTLRRTEDVVVLTGKDLPALRGARKDRLRAFARTGGALQPIAVQVDERTPQGRYCFDRGPDTTSDVDEGRLDDNDEVALLAASAGDRTPAPKIPGASASHEVELVDPRDGGRAWIYLFRFDGDAPPPCPVRHLGFEVGEDGLARWKGRGFEVALRPRPGASGRGAGALSFVAADGKPTPFGDLVSLRLAASFRRLPIEREPDEVRLAVGSWLAGPVRALAEVTVEAYLIWGNWVSTVAPPSSLATFTRSSLSASLTLSLPVDLDQEPASSVTLGVALDPAARGVVASTDKVATALDLGALARGKDRTAPTWTALLGPEGGVLARLALKTRSLARDSNRLEVSDRSLGLRVDLSSASKGEYSAEYTVHVVEPLPAGSRFGALEAERLLDATDRPLEKTVR